MRLIKDGKTYTIPYGMACCDTCEHWKAYGAHNDHWYECDLVKFDEGTMENIGGTFSNEYALVRHRILGDNMKTCPHLEELKAQFDHKQYKAAYVDTPEGRKLEVKAV